MNEIQVFNSSQFGDIRTLEENGKVLFCGSDVANALGYVNTKDALARHCKIDGVAFHDLIDSLGRTQHVKFITEGNLYRLVAHSKLPEAEKFEAWVFDEVLPTIRRKGSYSMLDSYQIEDPVKRAERWIEEQKEKRQLLTTVAVQNQQIQEMAPKACYYDVVLNCKDLISTSIIAKDYGKSAKWLNAFLHENGVQFKQGGIWLLYQKYAEQGYTSTKTHSVSGTDGAQHTKVHTYWTQKGRLFIYELLKAAGILPLVEA